MLAIRLQRVGRSGHAQFRVIVQDSRFSPKSGRVVSYLGTYDPHTKKLAVDIEKANSHLSNGARPSDRVARLLQKEGVKLPAWVKLESQKKRAIRHTDKLKRNRPPEAKKPEAPAAKEAAPDSTETDTEALTQETPVAESAPETAESSEAEPETPAEEAPATAEAEPSEAPTEENSTEAEQPEKSEAEPEQPAS